MKRIGAALLILCLLTCLCACGKEKPKDTQIRNKMFHSETRVAENVKMHSVTDQIVGGIFVGNFNDYTAEEKKLIQSYLSSEHQEMRYAITFHDDGTATLSSIDGEWLIANKWIKNRYTADLPEPDIGVVTMSMEETAEKEDSFLFMIKSNGDTAAYAAYCKSLEKAGYKSVGGQIYDDADLFRGINKDNKVVYISVTGKGYIMKITIPKTAAAPQNDTP